MENYPPFQWIPFTIGVLIIAALVFATIRLLRLKQDRGYYSTIGTIFKRELMDSKVRIIFFMLIGAAPGIILFFVFGAIDSIIFDIELETFDPLEINRSMISIVLTLFIQFFGMMFSITTASSGVVSARQNGSLSWFLSKPVRRWEFLWGRILAYILIIILIMIPTSISFALSGILFFDITDIMAIGGYIFLIGLIAFIALIAISVLCSTLFKKVGLAVFLPILIFMVIPTFAMFLPPVTRHQWPLLLSFSYYVGELASFWISNMGGGMNSLLGPLTEEILGFEIIPINLSAIQIILILSILSVVCFAISTIYFKRVDIS